MVNLKYFLSELQKYDISHEAHTFAGVPHGQAGMKMIDGYEKYPNFNLWVLLADEFLEDLNNDK